MTYNALQVLKFILGWGWRFMTGFYIPGTNVTPGACILFIFLVTLLFGWLRGIFNAHSDSSKNSKDS